VYFPCIAMQVPGRPDTRQSDTIVSVIGITHRLNRFVPYLGGACSQLDLEASRSVMEQASTYPYMPIYVCPYTLPIYTTLPYLGGACPLTTRLAWECNPATVEF
jgi:hypothetical protein